MRMLKAGAGILGVVGLAGLGLVLGTGCGATAEEEAAFQIGEEQGAIVGGAATTQYPAVPLLYSEGADPTVGAQVCSGTVISPRVILTAAHCVEFPDGPPLQYVAYFGANVTAAADPQRIGLVEIAKYVFDPQWDIDNLEAGHDIGLVLLKTPAPVRPMPFNRKSIDGLTGAQVHLVGWGKTTGDAEDVGVKREVNSTLLGTNPLLMQYGSATANTCQGDSGGPNFMTIDGVEVVAGITSYGNQGCDQYGVGTRVDAFVESFIEPFIRENDPNANLPGGEDDDDGSNQSGTDDGDGGGAVSGGCAAGGRSPGSLAGLALVVAAGSVWLRRRRSSDKNVA